MLLKQRGLVGISVFSLGVMSGWVYGQSALVPDTFLFTEDLGSPGIIGTSDPLEYDSLAIGTFDIGDATLGRVMLEFGRGQGIRFLPNATIDNGMVYYFASGIQVQLFQVGENDAGTNFVSDVTMNAYGADGELIGTDTREDEQIATVLDTIGFGVFEHPSPPTQPGLSYDVYAIELVFENTPVGPIEPDATIRFLMGGTLEILGQCFADITGDGALDYFDVSAFLVAYQSQDPTADFNADGLFNFFDVSAFLGAYQAGCP